MTDNYIESQPEQKRNFAVQRRLEFIDFRLAWYGQFNRKDVVDAFGLSPQQASADIAAYMARAPGNLDYNNAAKAFVRKPGFKPLLVAQDADRYLLQLRGIKTGHVDKDATWFEELPSSEVVNLTRRPTDFEKLHSMLSAIENNREIEIEYNSISSGRSTKRCVAPHAIFNSGDRWYIRAWSRDRNEFRDFNTNRIGNVESGGPSPVGQDDDFEWNLTVDLILRANPGLGEDQRAGLELEYDMQNGVLIKVIRLNLAFYLIDALNLDLNPDQIKPQKQHLVLDNFDELMMKRSLAREMSISALKKRIPS